MPRSQIFYINMGGTLGNVGAYRYAWKAPKGTYDNIAAGLGVVIAQDTDKGLIYGANSPKPPKVRITYERDANTTGSVLRFCEADNLNDVLTGGSLNNKKIKIRGKEYKINSVDLPG